MPTYAVLVVLATMASSCFDENKKLRTRPSEEVEEIPGYLDSTESDVDVDVSTEVAIGSTTVKIPKGSAASDYRIRLSRWSQPPEMSPEESAVLGVPESDIVDIELYDPNSNVTLSSSDLLSPYEFKQTFVTGSQLSNLGLMVIANRGSAGEQRILLTNDDLIVEEDTSLLFTDAVRVTVKVNLKLTDATVWLTTYSEDALKVLTVGSATIESFGGTRNKPSIPGSTGTEESDDVAEESTSPGRIRRIRANSTATCVITASGQVKCWGANSGFSAGFLASGDTVSRGHTPSSMTGINPVDFGQGQAPASFTLGPWHTFCVETVSKELKCWGTNSYTDSIFNTWSGWCGRGVNSSQFSLGDDPSEIGDNFTSINFGTGRSVVAAGTGCAILDNNEVKCWGPNWSGALGAEQPSNQLKEIGDTPGSLGDSWQAINLGSNVVPKQISSFGGANGHCVVTVDERLKCWGHNSNAEPNPGVPHQGDHRGKLGLGHIDSLGDDPGEMGDNLPYVNLGTGVKVKYVSAEGKGHSCAIVNDGDLKCWGNNDSGQLGLASTTTWGDEPGEMGDSLPYVNLGGDKVSYVRTGQKTTCVILVSGLLKCWGSNPNGLLGRGNSDSYGDDPGETVAALAAIDLGDESRVVDVDFELHMCAFLQNGKLKCWGDNSSGQLGLGHTLHIGDSPGEMGSSLPEVVY